MSIINNHQIIPYLHRHDISHAMIKILEEQRINDDDLQTMDRDDIEHLFKNDYGFTFRDRKQFWNAIQKFRSNNAKNDIIYIGSENRTSDIYDIVDDEPPNYQLTQHFIPLASSNIPSSARIYNQSDTNIQETMLELSSSEDDEDDDDDDNIQTATTSLPVGDRFDPHPQSKSSSNIQFKFPIELPTFSSRIIRAFETNNIESEWTTLINELAFWVFSEKQTPIMKREYQAIGQTMFKRYPSIGRDGFRPWSQLCKCLTEKIRRLRRKRASLHPR